MLWCQHDVFKVIVRFDLPQSEPEARRCCSDAEALSRVRLLQDHFCAYQVRQSTKLCYWPGHQHCGARITCMMAQSHRSSVTRLHMHMHSLSHDSA